MRKEIKLTMHIHSFSHSYNKSGCSIEEEKHTKNSGFFFRNYLIVIPIIKINSLLFILKSNKIYLYRNINYNVFVDLKMDRQKNIDIILMCIKAVLVFYIKAFKRRKMYIISYEVKSAYMYITALIVYFTTDRLH